MDLKNSKELKRFLDEKASEYESSEFIYDDPIQIPHQFSKKENIEIAGFLAASIAWGQRPTIIKNAMTMIRLMENNPYEFIMNANQNDFLRFNDFVHRTFNSTDALFFIKSLLNIYQNHDGLESVFNAGFQKDNSIFSALAYFRKVFFEIDHEKRTQKHVPNVVSGSAAKRINMFLRWMVRPSEKGVDFHLWKSIPPSKLMLPLDVHTSNIGRQLELLKRKQNDWKAVEEITQNLRKFDAEDPIRYDYALFGLGIDKKLQQ